MGIVDAEGDMLNSYTYDIWGKLLSKEEALSNAFLYAGELWDDATKLQYLRARWYDPNMGRFINEATYEGKLTNPLTLNLYTYVANNPLKYIDPSGHDAIWITNPDLAIGAGHTSALIENEEGNWFYFYWGDKNVQLVEIKDSNEALNNWGLENKLAGFGGGGYASATYIKGSFHQSFLSAQKLAQSELFSATNSDYNVLSNNCLQVTMSVLSLGTLHNGTSASRFFVDIWKDDAKRGVNSNAALIPNLAAIKVKSIFYNDAYTFAGYKEQLEAHYTYYDSMGWLNSKLYSANFHKFRINILLG